ncbi:MAG: hypothetical protein K0S54_1038 [Alphaproteobacteria bacterium]|jgi:hypothetical protein|nr:hypothetical protein [Alphaproteobacteria bacterium]
MIDLLPLPEDRFACPCGAELAVQGFTLPGMFVFALTLCPACRRRFLSRLHVDFASTIEFHCDIDSGEVHSTAPGWYHNQLLTALGSRDRKPPPIDRQTRRPLGPDVIIVNALDVIYGHCLHKLFSCSAVKDIAGVSVLAIVPDFLEWLVPGSIDEVWVVREQERAHFCRWNAQVALDVAQLAAGRSRLRYLDLAWNQTVRIQDYSSVAPRNAGIGPARVTVSWREDRCWTLRGRSLPKEEALAEQLRLYTLLLETLRQHIPDLRAHVVGYGSYGEFPSWTQDLRLEQHDPAVERAWAKVLGKSHLCIGVHGSNMIIPTAHAARTIEIVPPDKWLTVAVTWEFLNTMKASDAMTRYRLLPDSASLSDIAWVALVQIRRDQQRALGHAMQHAASPREALALRVEFDDVQTLPRPIVCRDERGEPL